MINILIVEDDFAVRDTLKDFIEFMYDDVEISEGGNGQEAEKLIKENKFDIMITDQMMPDMKGSELIANNIEKLEEDGTWIYVYSGQMRDELQQHLKDFSQVEIIDKFSDPMFFKQILDKYKENNPEA